MPNKRTRREFLKTSALVSLASLAWRDLLDAHTLRVGKSPAPAKSSSSKPFVSYQAEAREVLGRMTLEEKVGQMTQAEQDALKEFRDIRTYALGSLLSGGSSDPKEGNSLLVHQAGETLYRLKDQSTVVGRD